MKRSHRIVTGVAAALGFAAATVFAQPGPMGGAMGPHMNGGMHARGAMEHGPMHGPQGPAAAQLLTPEEQAAFREQMRNAKTPEERQRVAQANRAEIEKRAREKGVSLPGPRAGFGPQGMGPGMMGGMGPGMMGGMGPGMMRGMGPGMMQGAQHDAAFRADMGLVHDMLLNHDGIKRTVTNLPNGIRTVTESDDPKVAQTIKAHVASMEQRLKDGRVFNLFSPTIPVLFENKDKIRTTVEATDKGSAVVQTSDDPKVVAALQAHATEVSELARDGMAAMMRSARAGMGKS
jgi:hypothetical protein